MAVCYDFPPCTIRRPPRTECWNGMKNFLRRAGEGGWEEYCRVLLCANEFAYVD
jgi:hypothetical protein